MREDRVLNILPREVRLLLRREALNLDCLQEIRLRSEMPLLLIYRGEELFIGKTRGKPYIVTKDDLREMLDYISNYSLYAYEQEMRQGFITVEGGHRIGMASDYGKWKSKESKAYCVDQRAYVPRGLRMCGQRFSLYYAHERALSYFDHIAAPLREDDASSGHYKAGVRRQRLSEREVCRRGRRAF